MCCERPTALRGHEPNRAYDTTIRPRPPRSRSKSPIEVPRRHSVGWCHLTGEPHGRLDIPSPHFRLDRRQIEAALTTHLAHRHQFTTPPLITPAHLVDDQLTIKAQLRVAGHRIAERDLVT